MKDYVVIIPALNPPTNLIDYVKRLLEEGIAKVIVVNDGSERELNYIFHDLINLNGTILLSHEINKGKGRALKTAFKYVLEQLTEIKGVITADADGQHAAEDVLKIAKELNENEDSIVLGVRDFSQANVPWRSFLGNRVTSFLFSLFFGYNLEDTQTGLRGIPKKKLRQLLEIKGERYEYEMNMLILAKKIGLKIVQVPIQTLYFNNNKGSHYRSVVDSLRVLRRIIAGFFNNLFFNNIEAKNKENKGESL